MKLILGTVQFGKKYGINNKTGKIDKGEVNNILDFSWKKGIRTLDTAYSYGESENIIGEFIKEHGENKFNVISKLPKQGANNIKHYLDKSLSRLSLNKLYGYLTHDMLAFNKNENLWNQMLKLKDEGKVEKIGFSLYFPREFSEAFKKGMKPDIVQIPFNILDHRFIPLFKTMKDNNIEIHVRSVFLQGLVFKKTDGLNEFFDPLKPKLKYLRELSQSTGISIASLCLNYASLQKEIDNIIIGIDSLENLKENILYGKDAKNICPILDKLSSLKVDNEELIIPINW